MSSIRSAKEVFTHPTHFLAFGFGSGLFPKAPGTMGTLVAIPIFILMSQLTLINYLILLILLVIISIYICGESFSQQQAWMEGALQTSKEVVELINKKRN